MTTVAATKPDSLLSRLDALYQPGRIGRLKLKNRFVQSPMHTRFATESGEVSPRLIDYLVERARGGVALIILENTAVDWQVGRAAGNPVRIDEDVYISGLSDLTEAIHRERVYLAAQLHHAGRQNGRGNTEGHVPPVAPSAIASAAIGEEPRALGSDELPGIIRQFADGARRAVDAGFDMVEIHGSHGYLLTQFLSPQSNVRTDAYGGSFENRARFPLEVVQAVRAAVGPDFPVSYRISLEERTPGGMQADEGVAFCKLIEPYVDVLNVTAGTYESMDTIFMMHGVEPGQLLALAARVKAAVSKPVIGISRLGWAVEAAADAIETGTLDFAAVARTQLTDAAMVNKTRAGQIERVRRCIGCNECVGAFLFKGWRLHCVINPELGNEGKLPELLQPAANKRRVTVVGGGPAGCEVARVAALRGHQVILFERANRLGGQARTSAAVAYKRAEMEAYVRYFEAELAHLGVDVRLGVNVTPESSQLGDADVVVLATGAQAPPAPHGMLDAVAIMDSGQLPEGSVVVLGANEIGLNAAAFAAQRGRATTLVTGGKNAGYDMNPLLSAHTLKLLDRLGVRFADEDPGGEAVRLFAPDWTAVEDIWAAPAGVKVTNVGARAIGGRLFQATQSGFWAGTRL